MLPEWIRQNPSELNSYDLVHVDGGHSLHCITHDMANADKLVKRYGLIIIDDTNMPHINNVVDEYLATERFTEASHIFPTTLYKHRILQKVSV